MKGKMGLNYQRLRRIENETVCVREGSCRSLELEQGRRSFRGALDLCSDIDIMPHPWLSLAWSP